MHAYPRNDIMWENVSWMLGVLVIDTHDGFKWSQALKTHNGHPTIGKTSQPSCLSHCYNILTAVEAWLLSAFNYCVCARRKWGMNLCLKVKAFVTLSLIPVSGHPLGVFLEKTQEVREAIDCPWEDHSRQQTSCWVADAKNELAPTNEWEFQHRATAT